MHNSGQQNDDLIDVTKDMHPHTKSFCLSPGLFPPQVLDDVKAGLRYAFQTSNALTLALSATGHAGIECVMANLLERGQTLLVANNGVWGVRAKDIAQRQGEREK